MLDKILGMFLTEDNKLRFSFIGMLLLGWYASILSIILATTYYFFKGLKDSGILDRIENFILPLLNMTVDISRDCSPKLMVLRDFFDCAANH